MTRRKAEDLLAEALYSRELPPAPCDFGCQYRQICRRLPIACSAFYTYVKDARNNERINPPNGEIYRRIYGGRDTDD